MWGRGLLLLAPNGGGLSLCFFRHRFLQRLGPGRLFRNLRSFRLFQCWLRPRGRRGGRCGGLIRFAGAIHPGEAGRAALLLLLAPVDDGVAERLISFLRRRLGKFAQGLAGERSAREARRIDDSGVRRAGAALNGEAIRAKYISTLRMRVIRLAEPKDARQKTQCKAVEDGQCPGLHVASHE